MSDLFDVHVGTYSPREWDAREQQAGWPEERRESRPQIAGAGLDWHRLGFEPRWVGDDPSMAVAAFEANNYAGRGSDEWQRFQAGAARRSELALYISTIRSQGPDGPWNVFTGGGSRVDLPYLSHKSTLSFGGDGIALARPPEVADGLTATDRDLALRIKAERPLDENWVTLRPIVHDRADFFGTWTPLLITPDGHTVAGVWSAPNEADGSTIRHYMLPSLPDYEPLLKWLVERAIPDLVPTAAARSRRYVAELPAFQSLREIELIEQSAALKSQHEAEAATLADVLQAERLAVAQVRDPLLFGTGATLEGAIATVLTDAGLVVRPLDVELGRTASADFAVEHAGRRLLVEAKSTGGNAPEKLVEALHRHLTTWPQIKPDEPLDGGVLIVNHQHKLPPSDRDREVYQRQLFVDSLDVQVISTLQLFDWWRLGDMPSIRAVFETNGSAANLPKTTPPAPTTVDRPRRWRFGTR